MWSYYRHTQQVYLFKRGGGGKGTGFEDQRGGLTPQEVVQDWAGSPDWRSGVSLSALEKAYI